MQKKKLLKRLKIIIPLLLGVFFVIYSYYSFTPIEREKLFDNISQVNILWILLSVAGGFLSHLSRAYRWKLLIRPLGYKLKLSNSFMAIMAGYLANLGIPRSGEVLRGASIATYEEIPFEKVFGTIIAERAVDVLMLLIIVIVTVLFHTKELFIFFDSYHIDPWISLIGLLVLILIGVLILRLIKNSSLPIFHKIRKIASGILEGVKSILHMKNNTAFIAHTIFIWAMYILMFFILTFAFPEMSNLSFSSILVAFVVGSFAISITNGGIGIYPVVIGGALALFGIDNVIGEAFGWVDWGAQTILNIVVGGISLILLPIVNRKK